MQPTKNKRLLINNWLVHLHLNNRVGKVKPLFGATFFTVFSSKQLISTDYLNVLLLLVHNWSLLMVITNYVNWLQLVAAFFAQPTNNRAYLQFHRI